MKTGWLRDVVQACFRLKFSHLSGVRVKLKRIRLKPRRKTTWLAVTALQQLLTSGFDNIWDERGKTSGQRTRAPLPPFLFPTTICASRLPRGCNDLHHSCFSQGDEADRMREQEGRHPTLQNCYMPLCYCCLWASVSPLANGQQSLPDAST